MLRNSCGYWPQIYEIDSSNRYYERAFNLIQPSLLEKKWRRSPYYNDKNLEDLLGIEKSVPKIENSDSESKKSYSVYVVEYWKTSKMYF